MIILKKILLDINGEVEEGYAPFLNQHEVDEEVEIEEEVEEVEDDDDDDENKDDGDDDDGDDE